MDKVELNPPVLFELLRNLRQLKVRELPKIARIEDGALCGCENDLSKPISMY